MNTAEQPSTNPATNTVPADTVNTTVNDAVNGTEGAATDPGAPEVAYTRAGNVVPIRPDAARTPEDIPEQGGDPLAGRGTVLDAPADADGDAEVVRHPVQVDPPEPAKPSWWQAAREAKVRPLVPAWARSRSEVRQRAKWLAGYAGHTTAYHAIRCPLYAAKLAARAPRGLGRVVVAGHRWVFDAEGKPLRIAAVAAGATDEYRRLTEIRETRVRKRSTVVFLLFLAVLAGVFLLVTALSPVWSWLTIAAAVGVFGWVGTPADKPVIGRAVVTSKAPKLTSDVVVRALTALGIAQINQAVSKGPGITFPAPITRDGPGWRAEVDLPHGVTVTDVMERRDKLASGLRRPLGCVWPEPVSEEHAGRLVLWVGDQNMAAAKPAAWPLAKSGKADLFKTVPFGTDQRGRPVGVDLVFANMVIGAMPRMGKTFSLRVLVLAAALDPWVELLLFELKGTGDLGMFERVAHRYASGPDTDTLDKAMEALRELHRELERRSKTIRRIAKENPAACPENKVTPELARNRKLGLHLVFAAIDECQELFSHEDYKAEATKLAEGIIKRGPAMGVILILATQRPDANSLPPGVSANAGLRFCLRVMGQTENDMVLGTSAYKNGIRATTFGAKDKGIGYLVGAADDPQIVRSYYIDGPAAETIVGRARTLREKAGTITGHAAGEAPEATGPAHSLIADVAAVLGADETKVWSETIVDRLAALRPEVYGAWAELDGRTKANQLAAGLKPYGVETGQVHGKTEGGKTANRRGVVRADVEAAANTHRRKTTNVDGE
ncbi:FtsK/SpoIIIE domain-containing protein [Amycolatopsis suaedae]|uniref:FtsK/SpoIIIE domain-containing protein n=1 Tax=Amycolatopsis suaedae TaxID=2510978 RepID=UPI001F114295|nr:FtsK/SpoIIIE domain-containing protein [Amycolatopsis suaedae]